MPEQREKANPTLRVHAGGSPMGARDPDAGRRLTFREILDLVRTSDDYESALTAVARLSLPTFGAWSIVSSAPSRS
jgi:hypothetical protein